MKGSYLGIDIAIKEIEPSQKYHVSYFFYPRPPPSSPSVTSG